MFTRGTLLVTGASSGIGKAVAIALGHAGADVLVNYIADEAAVQDIVREIGRCGSRAFGFKADVSQEAQVQDMFGQKLVFPRNGN